MASPVPEEQNWLRRFRSSSFSSELVGCDEAKSPTRRESVGTSPTFLKCSSRAVDRSRAISTNFIEPKKRSMPATDFAQLLKFGKEELEVKPDIFPFQSLSKDFKLLIFSLLSPAERGIAALVCQEWSMLMKTPSLWSTVDLISFPPPPMDYTEDETDKSLETYEAYRRRTKKFINYLVGIRPVVKRFRFSFDIGDVKDGWLDGLQALLRAIQFSELEFAELNWNETPAKPAVLDSISVTWCTNDYKDLMYRHRHRQRYFVKFFDMFTAVGQSVIKLVVPFDWTERSIRALNRLPNLEVLHLTKYFIFQNLEQQQLDSLMTATPLLQKLMMEVWTPSGRGLQLFHLQSDTLEHLDVSQCRGFYLESVNLPHLKVFKVSICPMNGPLVSSEGISVVCMHKMLCEGAPEMERLNEHRLGKGWKESTDTELDKVLMSVCPCKMHIQESN